MENFFFPPPITVLIYAFVSENLSWTGRVKHETKCSSPSNWGTWGPDHHSNVLSAAPSMGDKTFSLQLNFCLPKPSIPSVLPTPQIWLFSNPLLAPILFKPVPPVSCTPPKCHLCGFFQTTNAKLLDSPLFTCFRAALTGPTAWNTAIKLTTQPIKVWPAAVS